MRSQQLVHGRPRVCFLIGVTSGIRTKPPEQLPPGRLPPDNFHLRQFPTGTMRFKHHIQAIKSSLLYRVAVPSPWGATGRGVAGLSPPRKPQALPNWNMKNHELVEFLSNLNVKPPLHERKALPHKRNAPLLTTFWRRFCRVAARRGVFAARRLGTTVLWYCSFNIAQQKCFATLLLLPCKTQIKSYSKTKECTELKMNVERVWRGVWRFELKRIWRKRVWWVLEMNSMR